MGIVSVYDKNLCILESGFGTYEPVVNGSKVLYITWVGLSRG